MDIISPKEVQRPKSGHPTARKQAFEFIQSPLRNSGFNGHDAMSDCRSSMVGASNPYRTRPSDIESHVSQRTVANRSARIPIRN